MGDRVSGAELARRLGISPPAVHKHERNGLYRRGKDGLFDFEACKAAWLANRDPDAALKGVVGGEAAKVARGGQEPAGDQGVHVPETNLSKARTAAAVLDAQKRKIELDRLKGDLIARADVEAAIRTAQTIVVERLEGLPGLLAARVMQAPSVPAAEAIIREAIRGVREELARMGTKMEALGD